MRHGGTLFDNIGQGGTPMSARLTETSLVPIQLLHSVSFTACN